MCKKQYVQKAFCMIVAYQFFIPQAAYINIVLCTMIIYAALAGHLKIILRSLFHFGGDDLDAAVGGAGLIFPG